MLTLILLVAIGGPFDYPTTNIELIKCGITTANCICIGFDGTTNEVTFLTVDYAVTKKDGPLKIKNCSDLRIEYIDRNLQLAIIKGTSSVFREPIEFNLDFDPDATDHKDDKYSASLYYFCFQLLSKTEETKAGWYQHYGHSKFIRIIKSPHPNRPDRHYLVTANASGVGTGGGAVLDISKKVIGVLTYGRSVMSDTGSDDDDLWTGDEMLSIPWDTIKVFLEEYRSSQ